MIEHFNQWFFGSGGYEFMGVILEISVVCFLGSVLAFFVGQRLS